MRSIIILVIAVSLCSLWNCATPYQPKGMLGGYSSEALGNDILDVRFQGNQHSDPNDVNQYLLYRCAELTLENNYKYFVILVNESHFISDTTKADTPPPFKSTSSVSGGNRVIVMADLTNPTITSEYLGIFKIGMLNQIEAQYQDSILSAQNIIDQLEVKFDATQRATSWLNERIGSLRERLQKSEQAAEAYRTEISTQFGQGSKLTNQQISELNTQIILAQAKQAEAKARLGQVERLFRVRGDLTSAAEVLNSPLINRLREQEAQVLRKVSEMESRYGPRHPNMIKAKAELQDLRGSIEREVKKIAQSGILNRNWYSIKIYVKSWYPSDLIASTTFKKFPAIFFDIMACVPSFNVGCSLERWPDF